MIVVTTMQTGIFDGTHPEMLWNEIKCAHAKFGAFMKVVL